MSAVTIACADADLVAQELAQELRAFHGSAQRQLAGRNAALRNAHRVRPEGEVEVARGGLDAGGQHHFPQLRRGETKRAALAAEGAREEVHRAHELRDEAVHGEVEQFHRRAHLLDHALVHHRDALAGGERFFLVVGDEDRGDAEPALQLHQLLARLHAQLRVEVGERLVEQQHLRLDGEGARDGHALLLAAGELPGPAPGELGEPHEVEHGLRPGADLVARELSLLQPEGDVLFHRHVRPQRVVLEHHADVALPRRGAGDVPAADEHLSMLVLVEPGDQAKERGLAGARRPEEREELAGLRPRR